MKRSPITVATTHLSAAAAFSQPPASAMREVSLGSRFCHSRSVELMFSDKVVINGSVVSANGRTAGEAGAASAGVRPTGKTNGGPADFAPQLGSGALVLGARLLLGRGGANFNCWHCPALA